LSGIHILYHYRYGWRIAKRAVACPCLCSCSHVWDLSGYSITSGEHFALSRIGTARCLIWLWYVQHDLLFHFLFSLLAYYDLLVPRKDAKRSDEIPTYASEFDSSRTQKANALYAQKGWAAGHPPQRDAQCTFRHNKFNNKRWKQIFSG
jgi:hypothetical protein